MTESIANDFKLLRTILSSDDYLQIRSSGEFNHISIQPHPAIQIQCFIHGSASALILGNLHDLNIDQISTNRSLNQEQWIEIRENFHRLVQQATPDTSLYSIVQSIEEQLAKPINTSQFRGGDLISNRIKRNDALPGRDINHSMMKDYPLNLRQGMYQFDRSINQWTICSYVPSIISDHQPMPARDRVYLPEQCHFLTWNILSSHHPSTKLHPSERFREILKTLQSLLPDIICLQEVTRTFLDLLMEENWVRENNYSMIIMNSVLHSDGQLMLMKDVQPGAFEIYPLENSHRECIVTRFSLKSNVMIDLINLHLDRSDEKRSEKLEHLLRKLKNRNYMIIGDVNFGDHDLIEESILERSKYQIHDLWKEFYDLDENPGYTIDRIRNTCAEIIADVPSSFRADRYLLHKLSNLTYSTTQLNIVGLETISIDGKYLNQSNHYALQLRIWFQIRSLSHRSILAIVPSSEVSAACLEQRAYIKLCHPFFESMTTEDDEENVLLPLRLCLAQNHPFDIELSPSTDASTGAMRFSEQSRKFIQHLIEQIKQLFPQCTMNDDYSSVTSNQSNRFSVRHIYILRQWSDHQVKRYSITHQLPLGAVLEPIGLHRNDCISDEIGEFFHRKSLYSDEKFFKQKQEKFNRLSRCFEGIFHPDTVHCFTHAFLPYGSYRLGLHGDDLDTAFVLCQENSPTSDKTELDQKLLRLKHDRLALHAHLISLLEQQIVNDLHEEILDCRKIEALYPIILIIFTDQTRVEIFVQTIFNEQDESKRNLLSNFDQPLHGVHDIERLITYVRFPVIFQHLLTFIRTWARNVGLYGQVYGYLGGFSWAILCASICREHLPEYLEMLSLEQFFGLVKQFFSTYANFNWSRHSISIYPHHLSRDIRGTMQILCPSPPYDNSSRSTTHSTQQLIIQAFRQACDEENEMILDLVNEFPDSTIQSVLQLTLSGQNITELNQWIGYMKSRLAHFLTDCEENCQLFIQTDHRVESRGNALERFYSLGFQFNEKFISRHQEFYRALKKFLDQFIVCPWRTKTMKLSYKLVSIKQWQDERSSN